MEPISNVPLLQANSNNIQSDSLDCGIKALGWCSGAKCQNLATTRNFLIVFCIVRVLQGAVRTYFRISAQQAGVDLEFDSNALDWLFATTGLVQGFVALGLVFYSQKFHPMSWISGFILLEAAFCIITIIPALNYLPNLEENIPPVYAPPLCDSHISRPEIEKVHSTTTLVLLFVLQSIISLTGAIVYCVGFSYMDDNTKTKDVAIFMGVALAVGVWGAQLGSAISLQVDSLPLGWWLGWVILVPLLLVAGITIGLFPRKLIKTIVRQAADLIIQRISQPNLIDTVGYVKEFTFLSSLKRLFTNKILLCNLTAFVFLETALVNYFTQEENYMQSRFYMQTSEANGLLDEWTSRFLLIILSPPIVGFAILVSGFIIAKLAPRARGLASWNAIVEILVCLFFISYIFIHCSSDKLANSYKNRVTQPYCSSHCLCGDDVLFTPVCPGKGTKTYFSPCHAGCKFSHTVNKLMIYQNCSCGANPEIPIFNGIATAGACNNDECQVTWLIYQVLTLFAGILLGTCEVCRMLITFRSVLPQDKAIALALELTLAGVIVNIPGKLAYNYIADATCEFWSRDAKTCFLHQSPLHGNLLNIVSAVLFAFAAFFDLLNVVFSKDLDCFSKQTPEQELTTIRQLRTMNSRYEQTDSNQNPNTEITQQPQPISFFKHNPESSPDSSVLQDSPRRIGGRHSRSPINSDAVVYSEIRNEESPNQNLRTPNRLSPQSQNLNYAQVMFEFKNKKPLIQHNSAEKPTTTSAGSDLEENLDFRLQKEPIPNRQDVDADDELSELDTNRRSVKAKGKETSF